MAVPRFEKAIGDATTNKAVWAAVAGHFHGSAVNRVSYLHLPPLGAVDETRPRMYTEGFPDWLVARYFDEGLFRSNPAIKLAANQMQPIYWDELAQHEPRNEREREFLEQFKAVQLGSGVAIHAFGPSGRNGQFGLGFRDGVRRLEPEALSDAQWICQLAHLRYCALLTPTLGTPIDLSDRESEVLAWVARGKSNVTIGEILGISTHTVNAHMRRIYLKLGVFDRVTAAVRGIGNGLIHAES